MVLKNPTEKTVDLNGSKTGSGAAYNKQLSVLGSPSRRIAKTQNEVMHTETGALECTLVQ